MTRLRPLAVLLAAIALVGVTPADAGAGSRGTASDRLSPGVEATADWMGRIRPDLAAVVVGERAPDPRVAGLIPGMRDDEVAYFAVLAQRNDAERRRQIEGTGARVLRTYRSIDAFALVSGRDAVRSVAQLPSVEWLAPIEVVSALDHDGLPDQTGGTAGDLGAEASWAAGRVGAGVRIAVLDTGHDPVHPDLDDLDFRHWSTPLPLAPRKVVDARDFNGGACKPFAGDGHGHGTHVAAIAAGTAEGSPTAPDDGRYPGVAPGAELAVGKVLTDAGAGLNSDLIAALEWAAMPAESGPGTCAVGADIVNLSLGTESRPVRLNSGRDADLVSLVLNRLAVRYGTLFVAALGNSGPYIGSALEAPGSAAQVLSVGAAAKDWDVNHDETQSGDTCAGWRHPRSPSTADNDCRAGAGDQPPSVASFSSRGPTGDLFLRPDVVAPGYAIVSAQSATGTALAANDLNKGTRIDPLYATASGTSMAAPAAAGAAALILEAYRDAHGADPGGASGLSGVKAPAYALIRAAMMNTARGELFESRWILTTDATTRIDCPGVPDPLGFGPCQFADLIAAAVRDSLGSLTLYDVRNGAADPYPGPLAEGAGKVHIGRAAGALRDGVVIYSTASGTGVDAGTGPRDLQGSWQVGAIAAGTVSEQRFVVHAAPRAPNTRVSFSFDPGHPSDGSRAIPASWLHQLPAPTRVGGNGPADREVTFRVAVPNDAQAGSWTGTVIARTSTGTVLRIPVHLAVAVHDRDPLPGSTSGAQAVVASDRDVFAKDDTLWPSVAGAAAGAAADWRVYAVELAPGLAEARFAVADAASGDETYDLYVYDSALALVATSHPFAAPGVTDVPAQHARGPSTAEDPTLVTLVTPAGGRYYVAVNRARIGRGAFDPAGDMGAFTLSLDEVETATRP